MGSPDTLPDRSNPPEGFAPGKRFAVIILNLNGREVLVDCLASLRKSTYRDFFVIVVDNGSTDDSAEVLRRDFPETEVIETGQNLGFTGGNNVGMQRALERGAAILMLLNNDTVLAENCLGELVAGLDAEPGIGAVTPRILFHDRPDRIWSAGGEYSLWRGIARHRGLRAPAEASTYAYPRDVGFATGCALIWESAALQSSVRPLLL